MGWATRHPRANLLVFVNAVSAPRYAETSFNQVAGGYCFTGISDFTWRFFSRRVHNF